jgi:hypothetical protein
MTPRTMLRYAIERLTDRLVDESAIRKAIAVLK